MATSRSINLCFALQRSSDFLNIVRLSSNTLAVCKRHLSNGTLPIPPKLSGPLEREDMISAKDWIEKFKRASIPREAVQLSFARSSGPGGQNVNKVNTKCTVRCPMSAAWIPLWARTHLRKSTNYVTSSDDLLITSTATRSQAQNVDDCLSKLHKVIIDASIVDLKNEPTEEQKHRVRGLQKAQSERRKQEKVYRSQTKRSRSNKYFWD